MSAMWSRRFLLLGAAASAGATVTVTPISTAAAREDVERDARIRAAERVYHDWDEALGNKDLDAAVRLYASDATIESPLVRHLLGEDGGIVSGRDALRRFIELVFQRTPALRQRSRNRLFTDGTMLMWEYPRAAPQAEQMDLVEVMELRDGLIQHHRVYWGWRALRVLERNEYHRG